MTAEAPRAASACPRRSARAASRAARESKRRTVRVVMATLSRASAAFGTLTDGGVYGEVAPAAHAVQLQARARLVIGDASECVLGAARGGAVDLEQQIAGLQPGPLRRAADVQRADHHPGLAQPELLGLLLGHVLGYDADPAAYHAAVRDDLAHHAAHHVHRDREADTLDAEILGDDRRVDADQLAAGVDQRPPRIAEVDRRVGLDEVLERGDAELLAPGEADDAMRHGL